MMQQGSETKIAVIEAKQAAIRSDIERMHLRLDAIDDKLERLFESMNRGRGAFSAALMFAGLIGAALARGIDWLLSR